MSNMASTDVQRFQREDPFAKTPSQSTELWVRNHFQGKRSWPRRETTRLSIPPTTTPILKMPSEILHQICQDVFWYHVLLGEVDILRCSSQRCFTKRAKAELEDKFLTPRKGLLDQALKTPGFSWYDISRHDFGRNPPIPLLCVCKRLQQVVQDILYSYQVFHIHIQARGTEWTLRDQFHQNNNLKWYRYKLRNVMVVLEVNTANQGSTFSTYKDAFHRYDRAGLRISYKDKVEDRKEQLREAMTTLMHQRHHKFMDICVKLSIIRAPGKLNKGPLPNWKIALLQNILQPLDRLQGWAIGVSEAPLAAEPYGSLPASEVYPEAVELHRVVNTTVNNLLKEEIRIARFT